MIVQDAMLQKVVETCSSKKKCLLVGNMFYVRFSLQNQISFKQIENQNLKNVETRKYVVNKCVRSYE